MIMSFRGKGYDFKSRDESDILGREIVQMFKDGKSIKEIVKIKNLSYSSVWHRLRSERIETLKIG
jgi:DNA invertase Pin-like site-specific DNA recombinase